jgi:hypothetical protein
MIGGSLAGIILLVMGLTTKRDPAETDLGQAIQEQSDEMPAPETGVAGKPCPACGAQNPAQNNFCQQCGTALSSK